MTAPGEAGGRRCPVIPAAVTGRAPHVSVQLDLDRIRRQSSRHASQGALPGEQTAGSNVSDTAAYKSAVCPAARSGRVAVNFEDPATARRPVCSSSPCAIGMRGCRSLGQVQRDGLGDTVVPRCCARPPSVATRVAAGFQAGATGSDRSLVQISLEHQSRTLFPTEAGGSRLCVEPRGDRRSTKAAILNEDARASAGTRLPVRTRCRSHG